MSWPGWSVNKFMGNRLDSVHWWGKSQPKSEWHHSLGVVLNCESVEELNWVVSMCTFFCVPDCRCYMTTLCPCHHDFPVIVDHNLELWDKINCFCPKSLFSGYYIIETETKLKQSEKYSDNTNSTNFLREWKKVYKLFLYKRFLNLPVIYPKVQILMTGLTNIDLMRYNRIHFYVEIYCKISMPYYFYFR